MITMNKQVTRGRYNIFATDTKSRRMLWLLTTPTMMLGTIDKVSDPIQKSNRGPIIWLYRSINTIAHSNTPPRKIIPGETGNIIP